MSYTTGAQHRDVAAIYHVGETRYFPQLSLGVNKKCLFPDAATTAEVTKARKDGNPEVWVRGEWTVYCFDFDGPRFSLNPQISYRDCELVRSPREM